MSSGKDTDVASLRREYTKMGLNEKDLSEDPVQQFQKWFQQALDADLTDANSMALATADSSGKPSVRIVLLKHFDEKGFVFYTNYQSRKAHELAENPQASLLFYWREFERQVRIEGDVEKISRKDSLKYFMTRPRDSQIGAWISNQSSVINSRSLLEMKFNEMKQKFSQKKIPLPDYWGGYRVKHESIEFWQGRASRLHDRLKYSGDEEGEWRVSRLAP